MRHWTTAGSALALAALISAAPLTAKPRIDPDQEASQAFSAAQAALSAQDWAQAELALERTLMYSPQHAEARLELALLLARRGRKEAAEAFVESLILDPSTPPGHRARLSALRDDLLGVSLSRLSQDQEVARSGAAQFFWEMSMGRSTNPLAGTRDSEVSLSFPSGPVTIPIDRQDLPAPFLSSSLMVSGPQGLRLEAQTQEFRGEISRSAQRVLVSRNIKETPQGTVSLSLSAQKGVYGEERFGAQAALVRGLNRLVLGWSDEATLGRASLMGRAERTLWGGQALAYLEHEHALKSGPSVSRFGLSTQVALYYKTMAYASISAHLDHSGYSVYLQNNAPRRLLSGQLVLERSWPLSAAQHGPSGKAEGFARVQALGRAANIGLFAYTDLGASLGIRLAW